MQLSLKDLAKDVYAAGYDMMHVEFIESFIRNEHVVANRTDRETLLIELNNRPGVNCGPSMLKTDQVIGVHTIELREMSANAGHQEAMYLPLYQCKVQVVCNNKIFGSYLAFKDRDGRCLIQLNQWIILMGDRRCYMTIELSSGRTWEATPVMNLDVIVHGFDIFTPQVIKEIKEPSKA